MRNNQKRLVSADDNFQRMLNQAELVAKTDATVLIRGENGSGKEVLAHFIHENSIRADKPLVIVNCASIPESLIESELFGYEEGSFTGAKKGGKIGKFQMAEGGTIFLDEIGDMPYAMQAKLLRVLQEGEVEKIGRQKRIPVNVRVIAATNQPLEKLIDEKRFRMDLFYRLNVVSFVIPPLRERKKDIEELSKMFLDTFNEKYNKNVRMSAEVQQLFSALSWPGNVRELRNCMESSVIMCMDETLTCQNLPEYIREMARTSVTVMDNEKTEWQLLCRLQQEEIMLERVEPVIDLKDELNKYEQFLIRTMISRCDGDKEIAAKKLNISKRSLYRKLNEEMDMELFAVANA